MESEQIDALRENVKDGLNALGVKFSVDEGVWEEEREGEV